MLRLSRFNATLLFQCFSPFLFLFASLCVLATSSLSPRLASLVLTTTGVQPIHTFLFLFHPNFVLILAPSYSSRLLLQPPTIFSARSRLKRATRVSHSQQTWPLEPVLAFLLTLAGFNKKLKSQAYRTLDYHRSAAYPRCLLAPRRTAHWLRGINNEFIFCHRGRVIPSRNNAIGKR